MMHAQAEHTLSRLDSKFAMHAMAGRISCNLVQRLGHRAVFVLRERIQSLDPHLARAAPLEQNPTQEMQSAQSVLAGRIRHLAFVFSAQASPTAW